MRKRFAQAVTVASLAAGVSGSGVATGQSASGSSLRFDAKTEFSSYADSNDVFVYTPVAVGSISDPLAGWTAGGSYLVDVVSAASVDIVSTASPAWQEVRHAGALTASYKPDTFGVTVAGDVSSEPDYLSLSGGGNVSLDLAKKTITPLLGYTYTHDTAGRTGTPFSVYALEVDRHTMRAAVTFVLDTESVLGFSADAIVERGRQEKPYRYVPLFDADVAAGLPKGAPADVVNRVRLPGRIAEALPDARNRYALAGRFAQRLSNSTFVAWQRGYVDDWGVAASTTDLRLVFDLSRRFFLWPHLRGHIQSGASFWQRAYVATAESGLTDVPRYRTGDRELGPLQTGLLGAGARWDVGPDVRPSSTSLVVLADGSFTNYEDALFVTNRFAFFGSLQLEVRF